MSVTPGAMRAANRMNHANPESAAHIIDEETGTSELLAALKLCIAWMPCAEVRSWPPGFQLRDEALTAANAAIAKAEGKS